MAHGYCDSTSAVLPTGLSVTPRAGNSCSHQTDQSHSWSCHISLGKKAQGAPTEWWRTKDTASDGGFTLFHCENTRNLPWEPNQSGEGSCARAAQGDTVGPDTNSAHPHRGPLWAPEIRLPTASAHTVLTAHGLWVQGTPFLAMQTCWNSPGPIPGTRHQNSHRTKRNERMYYIISHFIIQ